MEPETKKKQSDKNILIGCICLSAATFFMFCVFAPTELYFNNRSEFFYDVFIMLPPMLCLFAALSALSSIVLILLGRTKVFDLIFGAYSAAYIAAYIQGNYLVKDLPHLKGGVLNWNDYPAQRISSIILWVVVFAVVFLVFRKIKRKKFVKLITGVSIFISLILLVTLITLGISSGGFAKKEIFANTATSENMLNLSSDHNFLILVLDKVDAGEVKAIFDNDPEYRDTYEDFTFFTNAEAGYPYTHHSIPLMLTGVWYEKQSSFSDYVNSAYMESPILKELEDRGYEMGIYETDFPVNSEVASRFDNQASCERGISSWPRFCTWEMMMVGYRYAPFDLKRFCYIYTDSFNSLKIIPDGLELFDEDNKFLWDKLGSEKPVIVKDNNFRFIHISGAHEQHYDENMNYVDEGTYEDACRSSLKIAGKYIDMIKAAGVYDNSVIIVMADHGRLDPMQQNPILFIKGVNEHHEYREDEAPISYDDLMEAYLRLLDGRSSSEVFDAREGDKRERRILFQDDDDNPQEIMQEFIQTGHAGDMDTLIKIREF